MEHHSAYLRPHLTYIAQRQACKYDHLLSIDSLFLNLIVTQGAVCRVCIIVPNYYEWDIVVYSFHKRQTGDKIIEQRIKSITMSLLYMSWI